MKKHIFQLINPYKKKWKELQMLFSNQKKDGCSQIILTPARVTQQISQDWIPSSNGKLYLFFKVIKTIVIHKSNSYG